MSVTIHSPGMVIRNLIDTSASSTVGEAPLDGFTYARRNGVWVDVTNATTGPKLYIQEDEPTDNGDYLWIQTNIDGSGDFTVWFTDPNW